MRSALLYVLITFGLWSLYVATAYDRVAELGPFLTPSVNEGVRALIFVLPVVLFLRARGVPSLLTFLKLTSNVRAGLVWGGLAGCAWFTVSAALVFAATGEIRFHAIPAVAVFTSLGIATLTEEIAFRGYLLQCLSDTIPYWIANVISALLFAAIHIPGWLIVDSAAFYPDKVRPLMSIFVLGLVLGMLLHRTNSLWSCYVLHAANNLAAGVLFST